MSETSKKTSLQQTYHSSVKMKPDRNHQQLVEALVLKVCVNSFYLKFFSFILIFYYLCFLIIENQTK